MARDVCARCRRLRPLTRTWGTCRSCCFSLWDEGRFPVLLTAGERARFPDCPLSVRLSPLLAHRRQCWANHGRRLRDLSKAGGLTPVEIVCLLEDRPCPAGRPDEAATAAAAAKLAQIA